MDGWREGYIERYIVRYIHIHRQIDRWTDRRIYLSLAVLLFAKAELFVLFLVDGIMRNISVKLF